MSEPIIKIVEGQDRERVSVHNTRVIVSRTKPVEETMTLSQVEDNIKQFYQHIDNLKAQIAQKEKDIEEQKILAELIRKSIPA